MNSNLIIQLILQNFKPIKKNINFLYEFKN